MADDQTTTAAPAPAPAPAAPPTDLLSLFQQQQEQIKALTEAVTALVPKATPAPAGPITVEEAKLPDRPTSNRTQDVNEYVRKLEAFGTEQAKKAMAYELAEQHGLSIKELGFNFESPQEMRIAAENIARQKKIDALETDYEKRIREMEERLVAVTNTSGMIPPRVDSGGPSGSEVLGTGQLQEQYEEVKRLGKTVEARRRWLELAYGDPSRSMS